MKYINIADIHFGNAGDSVFHNQNLLDFFIWVVDWKNKNEPDAELNILGDVFHSRHKLSSETINYALQGIEHLAANFKNVNIIVGNHDMYHRDRTDINSVNMFKHIDNVFIVDSMIVKTTQQVMFHPWVINDRDYANLVEATRELNIKTLFTHIEFSTFKMNDNYVMEHGLTHKSLKHIDKIFTGHYHGRQEIDNVIYIGNPFPFDYNDANDDEKGFCLVDTDTNEHTFVNWNTISVASMTYDDFKEIDWDDIDDDFSKDSLRIVINNDITDEDMDNLKEVLDKHNFHDTKVVYKKTSGKDAVEQETEAEITHLMGVDETVIEHIRNIDDTESTVNKGLLEEIYTESMQE